jgi:hypothetical protein
VLVVFVTVVVFVTAVVFVVFVVAVVEFVVLVAVVEFVEFAVEFDVEELLGSGPGPLSILGPSNYHLSCEGSFKPSIFLNSYGDRSLNSFKPY